MFQNLDLFSKTIRFASLGSGSRGNATVVVCEGDAVLLDCGLSAKSVVDRLEAVGVSPDSIRAIALTHEHSDHVGGARVTSRVLGVPVYMTSACRAQMPDAGEIDDVRRLVPDRTLRVGALSIDAFRVPHDTVDPVGFVVGAGASKLGLVTDLGTIRRGIVDRLRGCRAVILEFNHDPALVAANPYPDSVKERVLGDHGHLSNAQAGALLARLDGGAVRDVVLAHISEKNNTEELALAAARAALAGWRRPRPRLHVAGADAPGPLLRLDDGRM